VCERCGAPTAWPVPTCRECGSHRIAFDSARAAIRYDAAGRRIVRAWKERGLRRFSIHAAELVAGRVPRPVADVITYIPPDGDRSAKRGHHPAQSLAEALGERWGLPVDCLLARTRPVARQAELRRAARRGNVRGAFAPARERVPECIVLVDDVYTTGATVDAAAAALRKAGAREVRVVTFARVTRAVG
jgi:predicted amidophosphoribosyltransferase